MQDFPGMFLIFVLLKSETLMEKVSVVLTKSFLPDAMN